MSAHDVVLELGDLIVEINQVLSRPDFPDTDPNWQKLNKIKRDLRDLQQQLLAAEFAADSAEFVSITSDLSSATHQVRGTIAEIQKIGDTIAALSEITGFAQQLLALA